MYVAREKQKQNIAEYLLYMYQIEDIIRAHDLDLERLKNVAIRAEWKGKPQESEVLQWYSSLIKQMKQQKIEQTGHLESLNEVSRELNYLHQDLLLGNKDTSYEKRYLAAKFNIDALKSKSGKQKRHEIQTCIDGLYGYLLLKIQKKPISTSTQQAMETIQQMIGYLAAKYRQIKEGT